VRSANRSARLKHHASRITYHSSDDPNRTTHMKFDLYLILAMFGVGITFRRLSWKGWFAITMVVFMWILWNWRRG
jgi:hypothetical protein